MILGLRTDKPEAELYLYNGDKLVDSYTWQAHRELSDTLLIKIEALLERHGLKQADLTGIAVYQGPGSFTGLRIGITVANTLAYSWNIPIRATKGENWLGQALKELPSQTTFSEVAIPHYGSEAHITPPKK